MDNSVGIGLLAFAYFLGAIPFGLMVAKGFGVADIRTSGSGNIGATNVYRVAGGKAALLVFALDIGKGVVPVFFATQISQTLMPTELFLVLCASLAVMGHVFPVYLRFRGGKGVNTALGTLIILMPREVGIAFLVFVLTVLLTRYVSLGSMLSAITLTGVTLVEKTLLHMSVSSINLIVSALLAVLILFTHRKNIGRLVKGTENRFSLRSKTREAHKVV